MAVETLSPLDDLEVWLTQRNEVDSHVNAFIEGQSETQAPQKVDLEAERQLHREEADCLRATVLPQLEKVAERLRNAGDNSATAKVLGPVQDKDNKWVDQRAQAILYFGYVKNPGSVTGFFEAVVCTAYRSLKGEIAGLRIGGHEEVIASDNILTFETVIANTIRAKTVAAQARNEANQKAKPANVLLIPLHNVRK